MVKSRTWRRLFNTLQIRKDYSEPPAGLTWRSNTIFILATITMGLFSDMFLYGLIVPVLPFMLESRVGVPEEQTQSLVSALLAAYAGASMIAAPISGALADKTSTRQMPFLIGLAALLAATVLLFLGKSINVLIIARILQGISGGAVWTIGLAMCAETVGPENLGKTTGSIFSLTSIGTLVAPVLGGVIYEKVGYGGVFALGCAILCVDFIMRVIVIEKKVALRYEAGRQNIIGNEIATHSDNPTDDNERAEATPSDIDGENEPLLGKKQEDDFDYKLSENQPRIARMFPLLPCLAHPGLLTAFIMAMVQAMIFGSFDATVPIVARELFGFNSLKAGLLFLPLGIADLLLGPLFGWSVDRFGTKPIAVAGYALLVPIMVLFRLPHPGGTDQIALYGVLLALNGMAMAIVGGPCIVEQGMITTKYHEVNPDYFGSNGPYAQSYGLSNMMFSFGLTVGPELAGELKQAIGYGNMNLVLAVICAVTAVLCFLYIGGRPKMFRKA